MVLEETQLAKVSICNKNYDVASYSVLFCLSSLEKTKFIKDYILFYI